MTTNRHRHRPAAVLVATGEPVSVVRLTADDGTVVRGGVVVETGPVERVFRAPRHDYTRALLAAIPGAGLARAGAQ
ncbi:hypothetical protein [Dactylosporangium sp. NPDC051484]|uniref:ABC transporter ATP-binding protein n=1 Tax=Dactylosporangium sp. NPDC051484 TaxID=3154942 RepID=UPI003450610F